MTNDVSSTLLARDYKDAKCVEVNPCAMRGRYDENGNTSQHIEINDNEYANAITTVKKDSMVAEK